MTVRRMILLPAMVFWFFSLAAPGQVKTDPVLERMKRDIFFLASPECEGRGPGTKGIDLAADYISNQLAGMQLKPGGVDGTWFQPFTVSGKSRMEGPGRVVLRGPQGQEIELKMDRDFQVMGNSGAGTVTAPLVFAGYGITSKDPDYDDFKGIDLKGKIVVYLRHTPRWENKDLPFGGARKDEHASLEKKQGLAETNKAAGVIMINDHTEISKGDKLEPFSYLVDAAGGSIPSVQIKRSILEPILLSSLGTRLIDLEKAIDADLKPRTGPLVGWSATLETKVKRETIPVKNILAVAPGSGPLGKEFVVVGAHYDHLGYGGGRNSLAKTKEKQIHHGADDNASGTTTMIELARRFASVPNREGRTLVFMAFSAEEMGLLGSRHYTNKQPLFPLQDTVAMVNLDMTGRMTSDPKTGKDKLIIEGTGTAKEFDGLIEKLNPGFQLTKKPGGMGPSDQASFYSKKIPVIFFFTGTHVDYHKPSDTADKINIEGMKKVADLAERVIQHLATDPKKPEYVEIKSSFTMGPGKSGPKLGIVPNYDENVEGVLVGGVSDGGPAAKGGIKAGDRIVEIAGKEVKNLNNYMVLMAQQRLGSNIEVGVIRDGRKVLLKVDLK